MRGANLALRVLLSLCLLGGLFWLVAGAGLWRRLASADLRWFSLAVILGLIANVVAAWRWVDIARSMGLNTARLPAMMAYGRGVTLSTILPGATLGGDAYRALMLNRQGHPLGRAALSVALDRLSGLWTLLLVSLAAWGLLAVQADPLLPQSLVIAHVGLLLVAILAPFLAGHVLRRWPGVSTPIRHVLHLMKDTARHTFDTLGASLLVQLASTIALGAALLAVSGTMPALYLLAFAGPVFVVAALPITLGGYGAREGIFAAYAVLVGMPADVAIAGALLSGLAVSLQGGVWAPLFLAKT